MSYVAYLITADAEALGDPAVLVLTAATEGDEGAPLADYPLPDGADPVDVLVQHGWHMTSVPVSTGTGTSVVDVTPGDWEQVITHVTVARQQAMIEQARQDAAWRTLIRDARTADQSATTLSRAAQVSVARIYQLAGGTRS